ncbi:hypothetical protein JXJ21_12065, partial [candidate division KSB1 bacterium]|nr:hypothetical protein [candidate division KSB1 bacterium]
MKRMRFQKGIVILILLNLVAGEKHPIFSKSGPASSSGKTTEPLRTFCTMNGNNIATRVNNYGTIGHNENNSHPSWRWPRNSTNRYGAEFGFILGGEVPLTDDTENSDVIHLVIHGMNNFEDGWTPLPGWHTKPSLADAQEGFLATYNKPSTWGEKFPKNPAGDILLWPGEFKVGENVADFECYYQMDDCAYITEYYPIPGNLDRGGLGVEVEVRGYQFSPKILADVLYFQFEIKNVSSKNLDKLVVGMMGDPLMGGYSDRSDDMVSIEQDEIVLCWDEDSVTTEFPESIGYMGFQFIDTPEDSTGNKLNLTSFSAVLNNWLSANDTEEMWEALVSGTQSMVQARDYVILMGSGYFQLPIDSTRKLAFIGGFGDNKNELLHNMQIAYEVYYSQFDYLKAPITPNVSAMAGDRSATIVWNDSAEASEDPLFGNDFEGYRIYRSLDGFISDTMLIAQFDKKDGITGYHPIPLDNGNTLFYLGDDSELAHQFVDTGLINGLAYSYAVTAYDTGSATGGVAPRESAIFLGNQNVVTVTPGSLPKPSIDNIAVVPNPYIASSLFDSPAHPNPLGTYSSKRVNFIH